MSIWASKNKSDFYYWLELKHLKKGKVRRWNNLQGMDDRNIEQMPHVHGETSDDQSQTRNCSTL